MLHFAYYTRFGLPSYKYLHFGNEAMCHFLPTARPSESTAVQPREDDEAAREDARPPETGVSKAMEGKRPRLPIGFRAGG